MTESKLLDAALRYAREGWAVFPLKPRDKIPMSAECTYKHATNDNNQVGLWWDSIPDANVGLQPAKSGLVVLDVDPKNGGLESLATLQAEHGDIVSRAVTTGSGGLHFYFEHPGTELRNCLGFRPGLDLIAATGHVVAPPSIHPNGQPYSWVDEAAALAALPDWLLAMVTPKQMTVTVSATPTLSIPGVRGRLSREAQDFLTHGAAPGTWNNRLFKAAKEAQQAGYSQDEFEAMARQITGSLDYTDGRTVTSAFSQPARHEPRVDTREPLRALVKQCHLIVDIRDGENRRFVNLTTGNVYTWDVKNIAMVLGREDAQPYFLSNTLLAEYTYNPRIDRPLTTHPDTGVLIYNCYEPPAWKADHFYQGKPLELCTELPEVYEEFFRHLTDNDQASLDYLLDWISLSLTGRNLTILTAIGEQGIGKGVLGEVLLALHGKGNFTRVRDQVFKSQFNAALKYKTLVYVDEADLRTKESQDRIKDTVNETIEIEEKGKDSQLLANHASFYLSSNSYDAVRVEANDRRFSIIQLTNAPLRDTPLIGRIEELRAPENIERLAGYLLTRRVKHNMLIPFRSVRTEEVREAGLNSWEEYVVAEWAHDHLGDNLPFRAVQDAISDACGKFVRPGHRRLEDLAKRYPEMFRVHRNGGRRTLEVLGEKPKPAATQAPATLAEHMKSKQLGLTR